MLFLISNAFHMKFTLNIGPFRLRKIVVKFIKKIMLMKDTLDLNNSIERPHTARFCA